VLTLAWHAWIACWWHLLAMVVPVAALRAIGGYYLYSALPKSLASGWREMIGGWIMVGITTPAIVCLAYAVVCVAGGQNMRPIDILRTSWHRIPLAIVATLIVHTMTEGPELLIPKSSATALVGAFLVYVAYKLAVMMVTFLLIPVLIVERTSVAGALDLGLGLISGHRWRILALVLLMWIMLNLVGLVHPVWIRSWYPTLGEEVIFSVRFVRAFLMISIFSCIPAAAYYLLRSEKQGSSPGMIARVFD
jgi:hypothetical protein